jgi:hypothetical protein
LVAAVAYYAETQQYRLRYVAKIDIYLLERFASGGPYNERLIFNQEGVALSQELA